MRLGKEGIALPFQAKLSIQILVKWPVLRRSLDLQNAQQWKDRERPTPVWAKRYGDAYLLAMDFLETSDKEKKAQQQQKEQDQ